jgi:hypothetical protein
MMNTSIAYWRVTILFLQYRRPENWTFPSKPLWARAIAVLIRMKRLGRPVHPYRFKRLYILLRMCAVMCALQILVLRLRTSIRQGVVNGLVVSEPGTLDPLHFKGWLVKCGFCNFYNMLKRFTLGWW